MTLLGILFYGTWYLAWLLGAGCVDLWLAARRAVRRR